MLLTRSLKIDFTTLYVHVYPIYLALYCLTFSPTWIDIYQKINFVNVYMLNYELLILHAWL